VTTFVAGEVQGSVKCVLWCHCYYYSSTSCIRQSLLLVLLICKL